MLLASGVTGLIGLNGSSFLTVLAVWFRLNDYQPAFVVLNRRYSCNKTLVIGSKSAKSPASTHVLASPKRINTEVLYFVLTCIICQYRSK